MKTRNLPISAGCLKEILQEITPSNDFYSKIEEEVNKYSVSFRLQFIKAFPNSMGYMIPIPEKVSIIVKGRQVGATTMAQSSYSFLLTSENSICFSSEKDFWTRWNRFKNLGAFL